MLEQKTSPDEGKYSLKAMKQSTRLLEGLRSLFTHLHTNGRLSPFMQGWFRELEAGLQSSERLLHLNGLLTEVDVLLGDRIKSSMAGLSPRIFCECQAMILPLKRRLSSLRKTMRSVHLEWEIVGLVERRNQIHLNLIFGLASDKDSKMTMEDEITKLTDQIATLVQNLGK